MQFCIPCPFVIAYYHNPEHWMPHFLTQNEKLSASKEIDLIQEEYHCLVANETHSNIFVTHR